MRVNPIATFTGNPNPMCYGQKTRATLPSSLDRVNVSRLVVYLRRALANLGKPYLFQPNDRHTRNQLKNDIEMVMIDLISKRAITDYLVIADESNNTPYTIDRNELWADVAIVPMKAVEFIYIPLRLKNTGELTAK
jgi:phage tail sheath protein FI